jgi:hypothetical protein
MSDRFRYYMLDDNGDVVPTNDALAWGFWFERTQQDGSRVVKQDYVEADIAGIGVSTVFLGLDHNHTYKGPPVLWESLVFGTTLDGEMRRYTSKAAAIAGHEDLLRQVSEAWRAEHDG